MRWCANVKHSAKVWKVTQHTHDWQSATVHERSINSGFTLSKSLESIDKAKVLRAHYERATISPLAARGRFEAEKMNLGEASKLRTPSSVRILRNKEYQLTFRRSKIMK